MAKLDDFEPALRDLPLFPLHSAVLFPGLDGECDG